MRKLLYLLITVSLTGCELLYPSLMLKTPKDYTFSRMVDSTSSPNYKISPNDLLGMRLFSQDGQHIVDLTNAAENSVSTSASSSSANAINASIDYLVEIDGMVKLPVIGRIKIAGLTIRETTQLLEQTYSKYFIKPYILLSVDNRRVIVFPGDPGTAKVIPLINNNTTIIEGLALAGGLTEAGKAREIKLIRGEPSNPKMTPQVYLIDLYTIDGINAGNTILQANDIIYVTPQRRPSLVLIERITPVLSAISSVLLTYVLIRNTKL